MSLVVVLAAVALAAVAAAGVVRPFGRRSAAIVEVADPLEDERAGLLQALHDLDREHASGILPEEDYRALRADTEVRAVAVLRAIEARDGAGELTANLREIRGSPAAAGRPGSPRRSMALAATGVALLAVVGSVLAASYRSRSNDQPITGARVDADSPLTFFQNRVREHPKDVAARLDLADAYLREGNVKQAIAQYLEALRLDPNVPEARATLGFLLYEAGKAEDGLEQVNRALDVAPNDPEALYFKGVILLKGLDRPADAVTAFQAYLAAAPFGARRAEVQDLIEQANRQIARG
jgi:tetratricopeptide (TPR) repeat protein